MFLAPCVLRSSLWLGILGFTAALTACASTEWHRPGATEADLRADKQACMIQSGNQTGVSNLSTSRLVAACLKKRGWQTGKVPPTAAVPATESSPKVSSEPLSFDQCFERCRSLTDRTKEQCFDTCLER